MSSAPMVLLAISFSFFLHCPPHALIYQLRQQNCPFLLTSLKSNIFLETRGPLTLYISKFLEVICKLDTAVFMEEDMEISRLDL